MATAPAAAAPAAAAPAAAEAAAAAPAAVAPAVVAPAAVAEAAAAGALDDEHGEDDSIAMGADCLLCGTSLANLKHVRKHHSDAGEAALADMGFACCPAVGCGKAYHLFNSSEFKNTSCYQHLQVYTTRESTGQVDAHVQAMQGFSTPAGLYQDLVQRCGELASADSPGAVMARGVAAAPSPLAAQTAGAAAAEATRRVTATRTDSPSTTPATSTTTPAADYDLMALLDFDMDRLKRVALHNQEAPRDETLQWQAAQPLVFAWRAAAASLTGPELTAAALATGWTDKLTAMASPRGLAALKMYYLAQACLLTRARGEARRTDADVVEMARLIASSPEALLAAVERLLAAAEHETAESRLVEGDEEDEAAITRAPPPPPSRTAKHKRARYMARKGEYKKAASALGSSAVADGKDPEVKRAFADLTPQNGDTVPPELLADKQGQQAFQVMRDTFNDVMRSPPRLRAAGCLHDTFEVLHLVYTHGGADALLTVFNAFLAGRVEQSAVDLISDLRAVIFYKDESRTKLRPIGIGEALRRLICRCVAQQDRTAWAHFFTHLLPEHTESRAVAVAEAEARVDAAEAARGEAVDAGLSTLVDEAQRRKDAAERDLLEASAPVNFPVNNCFSPNGAELTFHAVQGWAEACESDHMLSDDKVNMYNLASRVALFAALHQRGEFSSLIPIFRTFYGKASRIFLVREEGELTIAPAGEMAEAMEEGQCDDAAASAAAAERDDEVDVLATPEATFAAAVQVIRSRRGTHQGCVLATLGAVLPMHLVQSAVAKECPHTRFVSFADDTYLGGPPTELYGNFKHLRDELEERCDLLTNLDKLKAFCPRGGTAGIPAELLREQGGKIFGFKCASAATLAPTRRRALRGGLASCARPWPRSSPP